MTQQKVARNGSSSGVPRHQKVHDGILDDLTDTEISEGSKDILRNLVSKDLVLAYLTEAEINEVKWHIRIVKELYLAMHPAQDCLVTGEDRAAINDNSSDRLRALSEEERINIETFFMSVQSRVTRAREMKQQELMNTQIAEHRDQRSNDGGGGLLGRLKK